MKNTWFTRFIAPLVLVVAFLVVGANASAAKNPIHTNCSGTQCIIDAIWLIFRNADVNNPVTQVAVTTMNTTTSIVNSGIANQANQKTTFVPGDVLTVPLAASGELISTGAQFYDTPPVYFDAGGKFRAIMENVASCSSVASTLAGSFSNYKGNLNNCIGSTPDNSPLTGTWTDTWTTTGGANLSCVTANNGKSATCTSKKALAPGTYTINLTRTIKDLQWSAKDIWLNKTGIPTMNLHPFYAYANAAYLFAGWDTLHDAPMKSSATVTFATPKKATADVTVSASPTGPFGNGPLTVPKNTKVYLRWTSTDATSCALSGGMNVTNLPTSALNYPTKNLTAPSTTFTITCTGPGGTSTPDSVTVLTSTPTPSASPTASPTITPVTNNHAPVGIATVSGNGGPYGATLSVTKGKPVSIRLSAAGSSDPDGWATPVRGVSQGGRCQWNSDLNQGAPTFETTIQNPASPNSCALNLGTLTFNDAPGTYTYNLLRITDAAGLQSSNGTITVTVLPSPTVPPTTSPSTSPTTSPTASPTATPIDFPGFEETR